MLNLFLVLDYSKYLQVTKKIKYDFGNGLTSLCVAAVQQQLVMVE